MIQHRCLTSTICAFHLGFGLVRSSPFQWELQIRSKGIWISRLQLTDEAFFAIPFPVPPTKEQASIVRFLDHADEQIQRYIAAKERLIALLGEERQALVHKTVTRGLAPSIRLKPSGMEWLGDVPEHWEMRRLKQVSVIQTRITIGPTYDNEDLIERPLPAGSQCPIRPPRLIQSHHHQGFTRGNQKSHPQGRGCIDD